MNSKPKMQKCTKKDFDRQFPDDAVCLEWLKNYLYPDGIFCQNCEAITKHHRVKSRPSYSCDHCGHHVHPTAGTIFHKSPTPLTTWFYAIYLMASTRCGISAKQIERETGVTYKTAWRMFKQIRSMLIEKDSSPLGGRGRRVEMDETYMGGVRKGRRGRPMRGDRKKTPVVAIIQRGGNLIAKAIPEVDSYTLTGMVRKHVAPGSMVYTDELSAYNRVGFLRDDEGKRLGFQHRTVKHSDGVYVRGDVHTNSVEGFWSLIKRDIGGVYH
jgi:transposase-like protein